MVRQVLPNVPKNLSKKIDRRTPTTGESIEVNKFNDLVRFIAEISYANPDQMLFFRGQHEDYLKGPRDSSTFFPSIYREPQLSKREVNVRFDILNDAARQLVEILVGKKVKTAKDVKKSKLIQWSILQHYEVCKTPLLDFTHSLRVACSFSLRNNKGDFGYVFAFGFPYIANRIAYNSEHELVNIRLLGISPPEALRPYFQEGYLAGTLDVTREYDDKSELDFNRRLFAKFKIPNYKEFWGPRSIQIPEDQLFPQDDPMMKLCKSIKQFARAGASPGDIGEFVKLWSFLEENILERVKKSEKRIISIPTAIKLLSDRQKESKETITKLDNIRRFRNKLIHQTKEVDSIELQKNLSVLHEVLSIMNIYVVDTNLNPNDFDW